VHKPKCLIQIYQSPSPAILNGPHQSGKTSLFSKFLRTILPWKRPFLISLLASLNQIALFLLQGSIIFKKDLDKIILMIYINQPNLIN
jgi:predicted AAA+ superfamily ATPase